MHFEPETRTTSPLPTVATPMRSVLRLFVAVALSLGLVGGWATSASAHSKLVGSIPASGMGVDQPPTTIVLQFNEPIQEKYDLLAVTGPNSENLVNGDAKISGATLTQPVNKPSAIGAYRVAYRVISSDGHPVTGEFSFNVTAMTAETSSTTAVTQPATTDPKSDSEEGWTHYIKHNFPLIGLAVVLVVALNIRQLRKLRGSGK